MYAAAPGGSTDAFGAAFTINSMEKLQALRSELPFRIPVSMVREFSPEALTVTEMAHQSDVEISRKIYTSFPKFGDYQTSSGDRPYLREFDMGNDRDSFDDDGDIVVMEGRMVEAFDYRAKKYVSGRGRSAQWSELEFGTPEKKVAPQWRIKEADIPSRTGDRWKTVRLGFCDVGGVTNQRYLMASFIPPGVICGHSVPTIAFDPKDVRLMALWLGVTNSITMDYLARRKGALHLTFTVMDSLPLPISFADTPVHRAIATRALQLGAVGKEMTPLWKEGRQLLQLREDEVQASDPATRETLRAELEVLVARDLFGLTKAEFNYIIDPADVLPDATFENFGALKRAEVREFGGVFRTKELILETWKTLGVPSTADARRAAPQKEHPAAKPVPMPVHSLPDGAWGRPNQQLDATTALSQLAAILKALPGPTPIETVRLAGLCSLHPKYLPPFLASEEARATWARLVNEPVDTGPNVAAFAPRMDANWRSAFTQLVGQGCLIENAVARTWAPGSNLDGYYTEGWPDGRAQFVLKALRNADMRKIVDKLPAEDRDWLLRRAAA
jgi:hypothetical protein